MEYFIIIAILLLGAGALWAMRVPRELISLAKKANMTEFSPTYFKLKFRKLPIKFILEQYVNSQQVKLGISLTDLINYHAAKPDKTENMINVLIRAKRSGVNVKISDLEKFEISGGNIEHLVNAMKIVKNSNLDIPKDVLESHSLYGGNIETFVEIFLRAQKANLQLNWRELVEEDLNDEDLRKIVNILIRAKKAGLFINDDEYEKLNINTDSTRADLRISQRSILEHFRANIDIEKYANAMIIAQKAGLEIDRKALNIHYLTDGDVEKLVNTMIKAEKAGIHLTQEELVQNNLEGKDAGKIVKNIIRAKQADLDLVPAELIEFHRIGGDTDRFVTALIIAQKGNLGIGKKELEEHHLAGADVLDYVKSRKMVADSLPEISTEDLNSHYLKGGNVMKTINAILYARKNNVNISPGMAFTLDLVTGFDISEIVKWAVNPKVILVEPAPKIIVKDGILIIPKMSITVRGKIDLYVNGSREDVLFSRVNEAVSEEITKFESHHDVLKNLNAISLAIFERLNGERRTGSKPGLNKFETEDELARMNKIEKKLNESSAYELLDIRITEIIAGEDTLAEHKIKQAKLAHEVSLIEAEEHKIKIHAEEAEAKIRLIEAKAKVHEGMAEAMRNSKGNPELFETIYKKYQTEKNIFENLEIDKTSSNSKH